MATANETAPVEGADETVPVEATPLQPNVRRCDWLRFIIDHNPCYLLSGLCMLFGCRLLSEALYTRAGDVAKLVTLLAVINVYEAAVIALGIVLIRRRSFKDDGRVLLGLELLFLVDITFTNGVISTVSAGWGWIINGAILSLAIVKVCVILRALELPRGMRIGGLALLQVALLLALPTIFKHIAMPRNGSVPMLAVYLSWLLVGVLPVFAAALWHAPRRRPIESAGKETVIGWMYLLVPFASLLIHLHSAAWVYSVPFLSLYIAPVVIGLACALPAFWPAIASRAARVQFAAIVVAILMSLEFPHKLLFSIGAGPLLSPLRLVLIAAALVSLWNIWRQHRWAFAGVAVPCIGAAVLGPTLPIMWEQLAATAAAVSTFCRRNVPRTNGEWGVVAVASAFVLLAIGAVMSLRKNSAQR